VQIQAFHRIGIGLNTAHHAWNYAQRGKQHQESQPIKTNTRIIPLITMSSSSKSRISGNMRSPHCIKVFNPIHRTDKNKTTYFKSGFEE
jgi:hypothetical protein